TRPEEVRASWLTVTNGRLYSFGGLTGASTPTKSAYSAQINDDGSLGAWEATTALPYVGYTNSANTAHALNGYMYVIYDVGSDDTDGGGYVIPHTFRAVIMADGNLGKWEPVSVPDRAGSQGYMNFSSAMYDGRLYATG